MSFSPVKTWPERSTVALKGSFWFKDKFGNRHLAELSLTARQESGKQYLVESGELNTRSFGKFHLKSELHHFTVDS